MGRWLSTRVAEQSHGTRVAEVVLEIRVHEYYILKLELPLQLVRVICFNFAIPGKIIYDLSGVAVVD